MTIRAVVIAIALCISVFAGAAEDLRFRSFETIDASNGLADNSAQTITCSKTGRIIISTIGHINFYDGTVFSHISGDNNKVYRLKNDDGNYHAYFDNIHHMWLKDKHSVSCIDLLTERFISNISQIFKAEGIEGDVDDMFCDDKGRLWLMSKGRLYADKGKYSVEVNRGAHLQDIDTQGYLIYMFYSDSRMEVYNYKTGKLVNTAFTLDEDNRRVYGRTTVFLRNGNGYFQLRSSNERSIMTYIDGKTLKSNVILNPEYRLNNLAEYGGRIYVASAYGYWTYNLKSKVLFHRDSLELRSGRNVHTSINAITFDKQGGMWIGTENRGLLYSKPHSIPFKVYKWTTKEAREYWRILEDMPKTSAYVQGSRVNCRVKDSRGWTWTGTMTGLEVSDAKGRLIRKLKHEDGMKNEVVHSVVEDDHGNMWAGTSNGIVAIKVNGGKIGFINTYGEDDRVPTESFISGRAARLDDGTIVMQAVDHIIAFNPKDFYTLGRDQRILYPKFIRLMVNGVYINAGTELGGRTILDKAVSRTSEFTVNYDQNFISMTFSGLNYYRPEQTYYRYRVLGYDETWKVASYYNSHGLVSDRGLFHLPLPGLQPGEYIAEVQASMYPDVWKGHVLRVKINIEEPWWRTTGAYLLVLVLIVSLAIVNLVYYSKTYSLRLRKVSNERLVISKLAGVIQRCDRMVNDPVSYTVLGGASDDRGNDVSDEFVALMTKLAPKLKGDVTGLTMRKLGTLANTDFDDFCRIVQSNVYKSPRRLEQSLRLSKACMVIQTHPDMTVGEIAKSVKYESVNIFISSFYHRYKITPKVYRDRMKAWVK